MLDTKRRPSRGRPSRKRLGLAALLVYGVLAAACVQGGSSRHAPTPPAEANASRDAGPSVTSGWRLVGLPFTARFTADPKSALRSMGMTIAATMAIAAVQNSATQAWLILPAVPLDLGVAQDGGLPHLGCVAPRCEAARCGARPLERVACLGLTDGERHWLFDATPDFADQVHALGARRPDGVFLTHAHMGHYTGLVQLGKEALGAAGIPVYATARMRDLLRDNAPWSTLVEERRIALTDNTAVDLGGVRVTAFAVPHRDELSDTVGYRIEGPGATAVYIPDIDRWDLWDRDIRAVVEAVDLAFLDGTFFSLDELPHRDITRVRHPLVTESMDRLAGLGDRVAFLHLNHTNPLWDDDAPLRDRGFARARQGDAFDL